jgi:hypothetical protein
VIARCLIRRLRLGGTEKGEEDWIGVPDHKKMKIAIHPPQGYAQCRLVAIQSTVRLSRSIGLDRDVEI